MEPFSPTMYRLGAGGVLGGSEAGRQYRLEAGSWKFKPVMAKRLSGLVLWVYIYKSLGAG